MEIVFVHLAIEALQLRLDVLLRSMDAVRCRRARANCNQLCDVIKRFVAIESACLRGRWSWLGV